MDERGINKEGVGCEDNSVCTDGETIGGGDDDNMFSSDDNGTGCCGLLVVFIVVVYRHKLKGKWKLKV